MATPSALQRRVRMKAAGMAVLAAMPGRKKLPAPVGGASLSSDSAQEFDAQTVMPDRKTLPAPGDESDDGALWQQTKDDRGRTYYYNRRTKETSWTLPSSSAQRGEGGELEA